jgi:hypothetical protein
MSTEPDQSRVKSDEAYNQLRRALVDSIGTTLDGGCISYAEIIGLLEQIKWGVLMTSNRVTRDLADKKRAEDN